MALTVTWDEAKPAGTRARSLGDDDICEFKKQVREIMAGEHIGHNGSAITSSNLTESRHKLSSIGLLGLLKGLRIEQRSYTVGPANITISKGLQIEINGDICSIGASDISLAFSSLTASTSYYIYVATAGHEGTLTASNFSYATAADDLPSYDATRKGWYGSANKRAIGFFRTQSLSMLPFVQSIHKYAYCRNGGSSAYVACTSTGELTGISNYLPVFVGSLVNFQYDKTATGAYMTISIGSDSNYDNSFVVDTGDGTSFNIKGEMSSTVSSNRTIYAYYSGSGTIYFKVLNFDLDGSL